MFISLPPRGNVVNLRKKFCLLSKNCSLFASLGREGDHEVVEGVRRAFEFYASYIDKTDFLFMVSHSPPPPHGGAPSRREPNRVNSCLSHHRTHIDYESSERKGRTNKKAGNARWNLLAYRSFYCVQTMQNGEGILSNFLW